jgi:hypothetical protein
LSDTVMRSIVSPHKHNCGPVLIPTKDTKQVTLAVLWVFVYMCCCLLFLHTTVTGRMHVC